MNIFEQLVDQAMRSQPQLAQLRVVVEKELLHHDILREVSRAGCLKELTYFVGLITEEGEKVRREALWNS